MGAVRGSMWRDHMRTINKLVFAAIMFVAVGIWAVASIKAEATYSAAAAPGHSLLTGERDRINPPGRREGGRAAFFVNGGAAFGRAHGRRRATKPGFKLRA